MSRLFLAAITLVALSLVISPARAKDAAPATKAGPAQPPAAKGETLDDSRQYSHCVALARQHPSDGWEESLAWSSLGGGEPARHCGAIALIGLEHYEEAATRLEELATTSHRAATLRAGMLDQAGQAWLLAKNEERAYAALTSALQLVPGAPDLLVDRAEALAEAKNYKDALADLDQALTAAPNRTDALTFRGTAKRYLNDRKSAEADIDAALKRDPLYQDAWLEKGILRQLEDDSDAARQAWLKVLEIAPTSAAADSARKNIEALDVKSR